MEHWCLSNMTTKTRGILFTIIIIFLLIAFAFAVQFQRYIHQTPLRVDDAGYLVMVPPGLPVHKIAENLSKAGVMEHPKWFLGWMQITGTRSQVKAGEYLIKPGTTPQGLIDLLVTGKVVQHALTIVEGWTFERLMQAVNEAPKLNHSLQGLSPQEIMEKLGLPNQHPEGQFFPDTYYFPANTSDIAFLQRAYRRMQDKLNIAWMKRDDTISLKSPYEALILASIIEKETSVPDEYSEIAGVYTRRLACNMPLQADPTVIYGMGQDYSGKLTLEHLRKPSNYNTYLNIGLPPTPIAMPGQKAIEAAVRPKKGDSLYFVATGTDKRHIFSNTDDAHQKAVSRYRAVKAQIEKERSLAAQETAVIAEEEGMVAQKQQEQALEQKTNLTNTDQGKNESKNNASSSSKKKNKSDKAVVKNVKNKKSKGAKSKSPKDKSIKKKDEKSNKTKKNNKAKNPKKNKTKTSDPKRQKS